jgi:Flp pilus assembly protein TadG
MVFLAFLMAILEFGRAYNMYQALTNAAREGARFAVAPCSLIDPTGCTYGKGNPPSAADIKAKVNAVLASNNIKNTTVKICNQLNTADCSDSGFPAAPAWNSDKSYGPCTDLGSPKYCATINGNDTIFTIVQAKAPYTFLFFKSFGVLNIKALARMRNEY